MMQRHLADLPPPPEGKHGWPWTVEATPIGSAVSLPRISVVTPSFNQGQYLEETLRSILLQGYPDLELIVMDGGSTDSSVDIIRKYADLLTFWTSARDRGQSHAINTGFSHASGEVFAWLNSDDMYCAGALECVGATYAQQPGCIVAGSVVNVQQTVNGTRPLSVVKQAGLTYAHLVRLDEAFAYAQPGLFFPAHAWRLIGGLNEDLSFAMDHDLLCRMLPHARAVYVDQVVAQFRIHGTSKTGSEWLSMLREQVSVARRHWSAAGVVDEHTLRNFEVRTIVRQAGGDLLAGKAQSAVNLLGTATAIDARETGAQLLDQLLAGLRRRRATWRPKSLTRAQPPHG